MRSLYRLIFRRAKAERDMHDEMSAHLEQSLERFRRRGLSDADARAAARREFGNVAYLQEEARDARGGQRLETLIRDVRFAFRHFARTPLTAITLVLVLSLGIGVNAALYSMLQALLLRPAPGVAADDALVRIRGTTLSRTAGSRFGRPLSMPEINDLASRTGTFVAVAAYSNEELVLDRADGSDSRIVRAQFVSPNFFATLGVRPILGPGLPTGRTDDTPGAELAALIAHWQWEQLGGDTAVMGRVVRVNGTPVRIVGVAPPRFEGPVLEADSRTAVWLLVAARAAVQRTTAHALASSDSLLFDAIGRLTPGTTVDQASAVVQTVATAWVPAPKPDDPREHSSDVVPLRGLTEVSTDAGTAGIIALNGTGGLLVLLVVCTNVSALLVGAAVARRREIAIRLSLGASRSRIIQQLLTETSILALAGGALGLTLYWWIVKLALWYLGDADIAVAPDVGTVMFTALIALGTGIVFGLSPALHATRLDVSTALKSSGGGSSSRSRLQRGFIVAQIVLTQPLLVGLAILLSAVLSQATGKSENSLKERVVHVQFGIEGGGGAIAERAANVAEVMERVAALPGVEQVSPQAITLDVADVRVHTADRGAGPRAQEALPLLLDGAPPGYFAFQSVPIVRGRDLVAADTGAGPTGMNIVIESHLARDFWGTADPIGKRLELSSRLAGDRKWAGVVVGVIDTASGPLLGSGRVYTASGANWRNDVYLVRTRGPGAALIPSIRQLARTELPDIPIHGEGIVTLEQLDQIERKGVMQMGAAATAAGMATLLLASIGLYGVVALAVRQRHREIGVRVALGARPQQVIRLFFLSGVRLSALGMVLGLPLSAAALYFLAAEFGQANPLNMPIVSVGIALSVVTVAALASWIPARRAAVVDPLVAIRAD